MAPRGPGQHVQGSWGGFFALHRAEDLVFISSVLRGIRPQWAVELGTAQGGFAAMLAFTLLPWGGKVLTLDCVRDPAVDRLLAAYGNVEFLQADVLTRLQPSVVAWTSRSHSFLYCDNGNKEQEMALYAPFVSLGSYLGCHDYGSEVDPDTAETTMRAHGFTPFLHEEFEALAHPEWYPLSMTRLWRRTHDPV